MSPGRLVAQWVYDPTMLRPVPGLLLLGALLCPSFSCGTSFLRPCPSATCKLTSMSHHRRTIAMWFPVNVRPKFIWKKSLRAALRSNAASHLQRLCSFKLFLSDSGFLMSAHFKSPAWYKAPITSLWCFSFPQSSSASDMQLMTDDRWLREFLLRQYLSSGI